MLPRRQRRWPGRRRWIRLALGLGLAAAFGLALYRPLGLGVGDAVEVNAASDALPLHPADESPVLRPRSPGAAGENRPEESSHVKASEPSLLLRPPPPPPSLSSPLSLKVFNLAIVLVTSTEGSDRDSERLQVLTSLCTGENARLLFNVHHAKLYISIDGATPLAQQLPCSVHEKWAHPRLASHDPALRIASHYGFLLRRAFEEKQHSHVMILEDDLVPAADFASLFLPGSPAFDALEDDPSVWCVSAWNDVGVRTFASDPSRLLRTDIFPGLGWMASKKKLWSHVELIWPLHATTGWDNWLRANNVHAQSCIVPEVCRVRHISKTGSTVNNPSLYDRLSFQGVEPRNAPFALAGGSNLEAYEAQLKAAVLKAHVVEFASNSVASFRATLNAATEELTVHYHRRDLRALYAALGDSPPIDGEPRSAFRGVITVRHPTTKRLVYLVDRLACPWIAPALPSTLAWTSGTRGQSCDAVCRANGLTCNEDLLLSAVTPIGNMCTTMHSLFPCDQGCGHQVGEELPAYSYAPDTSGQCLVSDSASPRCSASHPSTARACACV